MGFNKTHRTIIVLVDVFQIISIRLRVFGSLSALKYSIYMSPEGVFTNHEAVELEHKRWLVQAFLEEGSVQGVISKYGTSRVMTSPAQYGRLLDNWDGSLWGIVRLHGRPRVADFSGLLYFFEELLKRESGIPVRTLWTSCIPSFKEMIGSPETLDRILNSVRRGQTRSRAMAVPLSSCGDPYRIIVGNDMSPSNSLIGKEKGDTTIPMGYVDGPLLRGMHRVIQRELMVDQAVARTLPYDLLPQVPIEIAKVNVMDVRVSVCPATLPPEFCDPGRLSSDVLVGYRWADAESLSEGYDPEGGKLRAGVSEIAAAYVHYLDNPESVKIHIPQGEAVINTLLRDVYRINRSIVYSA